MKFQISNLKFSGVRVTRRDFLKTASAAVVAGAVAGALPSEALATQAGDAKPVGRRLREGWEYRRGNLGGVWEAWRKAADDTVTIRVPGPEAGTGGTTQACMLVAEELKCDWSKVRAVPISLNRNSREGNLYADPGQWFRTAEIMWSGLQPTQ